MIVVLIFNASATRTKQRFPAAAQSFGLGGLPR
jgi:hypothetical protein